MRKQIRSVFIAALTLAALTATALAQPADPAPYPSESPVEAVVESLGTRPSAPAQPLVVQEEVEGKPTKTSQEPSERPRGKSRADAPSGPDKPLLEVKGF